jgi:hypothetical protein
MRWDEITAESGSVVAYTAHTMGCAMTTTRREMRGMNGKARPCPHCSQTIDLVGTRELRDEFGLSPNIIQHLRGQGQLPKPWLALGNRYLYLRPDVEGYMVSRRQARAAAIAKDLAEKLAHLPQDQVDEIMRMMTSRRPFGQRIGSAD